MLARLAKRWGFSSIPLFLLAGLAFGDGGLVPVRMSHDFIEIGAQLGILLLLFMLGLEYSGDQLKENLRGGLAGATVDLLFNFPPGLIVGLMLGWKPLPAVLLGGVTFISSSSIIARLLSEMKRYKSPETASLLSILVIEDLIMAIFLPLVAVLIAGGNAERIAISVGVAVVVVTGALFLAVRYGQRLSSLVANQSDEVILLTTFGTLLLVAGIAQELQVSAAIGAFLVGIAVSGPIAEQSHRLFAPLRDLFAATFFFFFGLEVNPGSLIPVLGIAILLAILTFTTKALTGYLATRKLKLPRRMRWRAGLTLIARGEFSIVIAGLGVGIEPRLGAVAAAYVLIMAVLGPVAARIIR